MWCSAVLSVVLITTISECSGFYIKEVDEQPKPTNYNNDLNSLSNEWGVYQRKLGLTDHKLGLLKSQKDPEATKQLLNRFIKQNPKYVIANSNAPKDTNSLLSTYNALVKKLKRATGTLKTSVNFELADRAPKDLKRSRRKISLKMVSDLESEKIDEILKMFNQQHGLDDKDDDWEEHVSFDANDYDGFDKPSMAHSDYANMYENLYEDEEDLQAPIKSHHSTDFGSFQDLIMEVKRNQWQREVEETKLGVQKSNEDY